MSIPYSLILRQAKPGKPEMGNKTFPMAQYAQNLSMNDMAVHMASHGSKYLKGDILAVATQLVDCIREQLLLGNRVNLGDLGTFYVALDAKPSNNAEEFTTSSIKDVKVRWAPSDRFKSLINEATFTYVGSREAQAEARKAEKLALNDKATIKPGDEPEVEPDDGGGNSGGGTDPDDGGLGE
jgi:predicted histone-like DNA-binding protein